MINACIICENIKKAEELKILEEQLKRKKMLEDVILFCENKISPILEKEMFSSTFTLPFVFKQEDNILTLSEITCWEEGYTKAGYRKRVRQVKNTTTTLDIGCLQEYMNNYGFSIELLSDWLVTDDFYESGHYPYETKVTYLKVNLNCLIEEC